MAKRSAVIRFDNDFSKKLAALGAHSDEILEKAMAAGAEAALPTVRECLQSVIGRGNKYPDRSTGEMVNSLGTSPVKVDSKGVVNVKIGFNEPRKRQYITKKTGKPTEVTNGFIANVLENGKHGQPPRPWLKRAKTKTTKVFRAKAQEIIDKEVEKL